MPAFLTQRRDIPDRRFPLSLAGPVVTADSGRLIPVTHTSLPGGFTLLNGFGRMGNSLAKEGSPDIPVVRNPSRNSGSQSVRRHRDSTASEPIPTDQRQRERQAERERRRKQRQEGYQLIVDPSETVDGGYLFPQGVYTGPQDFKVSVVRDCIIRRRIAPFYKGLDDVETSWTDEQLLDAVYGRTRDQDPGSSSDGASENSASSALNFDPPKQSSDLNALSLGTLSVPEQNGFPVSMTRVRSHTMSATTTATPTQKHEKDMQQIWLYRNVHECPICFLNYPRLNATRCCGQDICTECFVQIKRQPPHIKNDPPSHDANSDTIELVSESVSCPYCAQPNLGVLFDAPPFEWGISKPLSGSSANNAKGSSSRSRRTSIPATHPDVVTVDMIRPDWEQNLASARRRLARKSAAARVLHRNALLPASTPASSSPTSHSTGLRTGADLSGSRNIPNGMRGLTSSELRDLERRMIDEAIRASLQPQ